MAKRRSLLSLHNSIQISVPQQVTCTMPPGEVWFWREKSVVCKRNVDLLYKETNWCEDNYCLSFPQLSSKKHQWYLLSQALCKVLCIGHFIWEQRISSCRWMKRFCRKQRKLLIKIILGQKPPINFTSILRSLAKPQNCSWNITTKTINPLNNADENIRGRK